jgi:sulfiredoxin
MLMRTVPVKLEDIYVPARWRGTLDSAKVETIAQSILEVGQTTPIQVRKDGNRYVLVSGFHRIEAMKALGEPTIQALIVSAPKT